MQALVGDSTDNVPGVPGIGVKTAAQLIVEYGDLETLLFRAGEIKQPKRREALIENAEKARISRQLVLLDDKVALDVPLDDLAVHEPDARKLIAFLKAMEFSDPHPPRRRRYSRSIRPISSRMRATKVAPVFLDRCPVPKVNSSHWRGIPIRLWEIGLRRLALVLRTDPDPLPQAGKRKTRARASKAPRFRSPKPALTPFEKFRSTGKKVSDHPEPRSAQELARARA